MTRRRWTWTAAAVATMVAATMTAAIAVADGNDRAAGRVKACAHKRTGELRLAPSCKRAEKRVTWAKRGPAGPVGLQGTPGAPGALRTTPVNVQYEATRDRAHTLTTVGGVRLHLECGVNRVGIQAANMITAAEAIHGTSTQVQYSNLRILSSLTYTIDSSSSADLNGAVVGDVGTHSTENFSAIVSHGGVVSQVVMHLSRDTRPGRPACEFIGSVIELGQATVTPS